MGLRARGDRRAGRARHGSHRTHRGHRLTAGCTRGTRRHAQRRAGECPRDGHRRRRRTHLSPHADLRGHGKRQDRGVLAGGAARAGGGRLLHRAGAGDRTVAASDRALSARLRRPGGDRSQPAHRTGAVRDLGTHRARRASCGGGPALRDLLPGEGPAPHRRRRRARRVVQARRQAALPRARRRLDARQDGERRRPTGIGHTVGRVDALGARRQVRVRAAHRARRRRCAAR